MFWLVVKDATAFQVPSEHTAVPPKHRQTKTPGALSARDSVLVSGRPPVPHLHWGSLRICNVTPRAIFTQQTTKKCYLGECKNFRGFGTVKELRHLNAT